MASAGRDRAWTASMWGPERIRAGRAATQSRRRSRVSEGLHDRALQQVRRASPVVGLGADRCAELGPARARRARAAATRPRAPYRTLLQPWRSHPPAPCVTQALRVVELVAAGGDAASTGRSCIRPRSSIAVSALASSAAQCGSRAACGAWSTSTTLAARGRTADSSAGPRVTIACTGKGASASMQRDQRRLRLPGGAECDQQVGAAGIEQARRAIRGDAGLEQRPA